MTTSVNLAPNLERYTGTHKGTHGNRFRSNMGENIKGVGRNDLREVRDYSNAVPGIRNIIGGRVSRWGSVGKSRGRVRM